MPAPVTNGATSANTGVGTASSLAVPKPSGGTAPNVRIAAVEVYGTTAGSQPSTVPSGWTLRGSVSYPDLMNLYVYTYTVPDSGEPTSHIWGWETAREASIIIDTYFNVNTTTPFDVAPGSHQGFQAAGQPAPSITTVTNGCRILRIYSALFFSGSAAINPPTGHTERVETSRKGPSTGSAAVELCHANTDQATAGSTGTATASTSASAGTGPYWACMTIALRGGSVETRTVTAHTLPVTDAVSRPAQGIRTSPSHVTKLTAETRPLAAGIRSRAGHVLPITAHATETHGFQVSATAHIRPIGGAAVRAAHKYAYSGPNRNMLTVNQSSIETDLTGIIRVANTTMSRTNAVAEHGSNSLALGTVDATKDSYAIITGCALKSGQTYTFSCRIYSAVNTRIGHLGVQEDGGGFVYSGFSVNTSYLTPGWNTITGSFTLPTAWHNLTRIIIRPARTADYSTWDTAVTIYYDKMQVEAGATATEWVLPGIGAGDGPQSVGAVTGRSTVAVRVDRAGAVSRVTGATTRKAERVQALAAYVRAITTVSRRVRALASLYPSGHMRALTGHSNASGRGLILVTSHVRAIAGSLDKAALRLARAHVDRLLGGAYALPQPGRRRTLVARTLAGLNGPIDIRYRLFVSNQQGEEVREFTGWENATVSMSNFTSSAWSLDVNLPYTEEFDPYQDYVKAVADLWTDDTWGWQRYPLGLYRFLLPNVTYLEDLEWWSLSGDSPEELLADDGPRNEYVVTSGTGALAAVRTILSNLGWDASMVDFPPAGADKTLTADMVFDPFDDSGGSATRWLGICNALLNSRGFYGLRTDRAGRWWTRAMYDVTQDAPAAYYAERSPDGQAMVIGDVTDQPEDSRFANVVIVRSQSTAQGQTPITSVMENRDDNSPASIQNSRRTVIKEVRLQSIGTQADADIVAKTELQKASAIYRRASIATLADLRRTIRETYKAEVFSGQRRVIDPDSPWAVTKWTLPMSEEIQPMTHEINRTDRWAA